MNQLAEFLLHFILCLFTQLGGVYYSGFDQTSPSGNWF